ncbi:MAG: hypothetical protein ACJ739_11525 [Acidimicrobiales bacterium]
MSTKRQPSKQRRQTQNQRQRAAREARRVNAAAPPVPKGTAGGGSSTGTGSGSASAGTGSGGTGSLFSRLRGSASAGRAARTGTPIGSQPVGYRAALSGLLAGIAAVVVGALLIQVAVDASGEPVGSSGAMVGEWTLSATDALADNPGATADELVDAVDDWTPNGQEPYGKAYFPLSLGLLLPIVGAALAFRAVSKRASAKTVNRAMYVTLFGTLLNAQLIFIFLPAVVGVGIAAFQVRKAEVQAAGEAAAGGDGGRGDDEPSADGDVIDVEPVDDEGHHDEDDPVEGEEQAEDDAFLGAEAAAGAAEDAPAASVIGRLRRRPQRSV